MIVHIIQPVLSHLTGQCCVAMALGLTLEEAIELCRTEQQLTNAGLILALGEAVVRPCFYRGSAGLRFQARAIARLTTDLRGQRSRFVLIDQKVVYDPTRLFSMPWAEWDRKWKITGWLPIREPEYGKHNPT